LALRVPPGRTGRLWLLRRLEVGRRGADVLDHKRTTLLRERARLAFELAEATAVWERTAASASAWNARASAAVGPRALRLAALQASAASVTVTRRNFLGVLVPVSARIKAAPVPARSAAVRLSAEAHAEALEAGAEAAALAVAHQAVEAELRRTVRRLRAIEHRWIPEHEAELRKLELSLDEAELADIARARWAALRPGMS
jgi:V/A-type H+/Na+-transporting ATPase subunit D